MTVERRQFARRLRKPSTSFGAAARHPLLRRKISAASSLRSSCGRLHLSRRQARDRPPDCDPGGRQATRMVFELRRPADRGLARFRRARHSLHERGRLRRHRFGFGADSRRVAHPLRLRLGPLTPDPSPIGRGARAPPTPGPATTRRPKRARRSSRKSIPASPCRPGRASTGPTIRPSMRNTRASSKACGRPGCRRGRRPRIDPSGLRLPAQWSQVFLLGSVRWRWARNLWFSMAPSASIMPRSRAGGAGGVGPD